MNLGTLRCVSTIALARQGKMHAPPFPMSLTLSAKAFESMSKVQAQTVIDTKVKNRSLMSATLHVNVESLDDVFVRDLKKQFGSAQLEIRVSRMPEDWLTEAGFWTAIEALDWSKKDDRAAIVQPIVQTLATMPVGNIHQFQDILAEKLWQLDTRSHAQVFMDQHPKGRLSVDDFLYVRCAVVAEGKDFFEHILREPSSIPQDLTFEPLLHLASDAYEQKTGHRFVHTSKFGYETYSNEQGWA